MSDMQGVTLLKVIMKAFTKIVISEHRLDGNKGICPVFVRT